MSSSLLSDRENMAFKGPFQSTLSFHSMNWYNQLHAIDGAISTAAFGDSLQKNSQYSDPVHTHSVSP